VNAGNVVIICSRKKSSRLPNKAFLKLNGTPAIEHILKRVKKTKLKTVLAIPEGEKSFYKHLTKKYNVELFEGDPESPLHRTAEYLKRNTKVRYYARVTHDDLIVDNKSMLEMFEVAEREKADYVYCPQIVEGAGVEIIERGNLLEAAEKRKKPTEFISYFVKNKKNVKYIPRENIHRNYRLTMDYPEDKLLLDVIFRNLGNETTVDRICQFLDENQYLLKINRLPLLSIYTCNYNCEKYIGATISSVLNSGLSDFEYIVVDDRSTDNSLLEIIKYYDRTKMKLIINEKNIGLAGSSNIAVANCKGKYVMRLDADDFLSAQFSEHFGKIIYMLENQNCDVVYPAFYEIQSVNYVYKSPTFYHHAGGAIMKRKILNEVKFNYNLRHWDGLELLKRLRENKSNIDYYDAPIWFYRKRKDSMSNTNLTTRAKMRIKYKLDGLEVKK